MNGAATTQSRGAMMAIRTASRTVCEIRSGGLVRGGQFGIWIGHRQFGRLVRVGRLG